MKKSALLTKLKLLGYPLFKAAESVNANETLAEVVKSQDMRLWEGFPVLLANSLEKDIFDDKKTNEYLKTKSDKKNYRNLVLMSFALYKYLRLNPVWVDRARRLFFFDNILFDRYVRSFAKKEKLEKVLKELSTLRLLNTFRRYFRESASSLREYAEMEDEADLEYSLSQVFSAKQKELFLKKLKGEKMTKTEREYYSRSVRKKVVALANTKLHNLALQVARR